MAPRNIPNRTAGAPKAPTPIKRTRATRSDVASSTAAKSTKANGTTRPAAKAARPAPAPKKANGNGTIRPAANATSSAPTTKRNGNGTTRPAPRASEPTGINKSGLPKLGKGALATQVIDHMASHAKVEFSPSELANKLDRSSGAIANALAKFTERGLVIQTSQRPRRYRFKGARSVRRTGANKR